MALIPKKNSVRSVLGGLERNGLIVEAGRELGRGSAHERKLYDITERGMQILRGERYRMVMATQAIDRALARRALNGAQGGKQVA